MRARRYSRWLPLLVVGIAASLFIIGGALHTGSGHAAPRAVPLAQSDLSPQLKDFISSVARRDGVDPASVLQAVTVTGGARPRVALIGTDSSGRVRLALFGGIGMTGFVDPSRFVSSKRPLWVSESRTGPTTTVRELGVVGIATSAVARVSIENVNGSVNQVELVATPLGPYRFFAAVGEDRSTIPGTVRAYDSKGALVAEHKVFTKPLCPRSNPGCIG